MLRKYRHPELGYFHKLDLTKGSIATAFVSDAELAGLIQYLNEAGGQGESRRIIRILEEMLALGKIEEPVWGESKEELAFASGPKARPTIVLRRGRSVPHPLLRKLAPDKYRRQLEIEERKFLLNRELARHPFLPYAFPLQAGWWLVRWRIQSRTPTKLRVHGGVVQLDDGRALQLILDLAKAGYLNRLRRCSHCRSWLYAKFRHQNFCSTKCQQKHYTQSEEWKDHRRKYMRRYYQTNLSSVKGATR